MKTSRVTVLLAMLGLLAVAGCGGSESVPADAVAVLEGNEVTRAQLDALLERVEISYKAQKREFPKAGTSDYLNLQTDRYRLPRAADPVRARGSEIAASR